MTAAAPKRYRVVVIEWLSHDAIIAAANPEDAEAKARQLWVDKAELEVFSFDDSGIDGVTAEEVRP